MSQTPRMKMIVCEITWLKESYLGEGHHKPGDYERQRAPNRLDLCESWIKMFVHLCTYVCGDIFPIFRVATRQWWLPATAVLFVSAMWVLYRKFRCVFGHPWVHYLIYFQTSFAGKVIHEYDLPLPHPLLRAGARTRAQRTRPKSEICLNGERSCGV